MSDEPIKATTLWRALPSFLLLSLLTGTLMASGASAQQDADSGAVIELESRVTGNQEQPQVFHVVPWQSPDSPTPDYDPLESQLRDVFGHIERDELQRELQQERPRAPGDED